MPPGSGQASAGLGTQPPGSGHGQGCVVWCGVVWCGVVWCGAVRCGGCPGWLDRRFHLTCSGQPSLDSPVMPFNTYRKPCRQVGGGCGGDQPGRQAQGSSSRQAAAAATAAARKTSTHPEGGNDNTPPPVATALRHPPSRHTGHGAVPPTHPPLRCPRRSPAARHRPGPPPWGAIWRRPGSGWCRWRGPGVGPTWQGEGGGEAEWVTGAPGHQLPSPPPLAPSSPPLHTTPPQPQPHSTMRLVQVEGRDTLP